METTEIVKMYESGIAVSAIAAELGKSQTYVYKLLAALGVMTKERSKVAQFNDEQRDDILMMYNEQEAPIAEILEKYDITYTQLYFFLKKCGVTPRGSRSKAPDEIRVLRDKHVVELYQGGAKIHEIVDETGLDTSRIYLILHKARIPLRSRGV